MWFGLVDGVFLQDTWAAGTVAESEHSAIDREISMVLVLQFEIVGFAGDVLGGVGKG